MTEIRYFRRKDPGTTENLKAGLVAGVLAAAVASVSFYLTRTFLSRETMEPLERLEERAGSPGGAGRDGAKAE